LSTVIEVAKVLTPENLADTLPRFYGLSRREAEAVAVSIRPVEVVPVRVVVTPVRTAVAMTPSSPPDVSPERLDAPSSNPEVTSARVRPAETDWRETASAETAADETTLRQERLSPPVPPRSSTEPLTAELSRLHVTVSKEFLAKLGAARDALSHSRPNASIEGILEAGLDLILAAQAKRNGMVEKPLKTPRPRKDDHIPAHVRRAVWERDGGRCQWRFENGEICGSTYMVEVDHIHPEALGGPATLESSRLACFGHNQLSARRVFGDEHIDLFARKRAKPDCAREPEAAYAQAVVNNNRTPLQGCKGRERQRSHDEDGRVRAPLGATESAREYLCTRRDRAVRDVA
jgi:hypothetical protein